eukprot:gene10089-2511_t
MNEFNLPHELYGEIFSFCDMKTFLTGKRVSKKFSLMLNEQQENKSKKFISQLPRNLKIESLLKEKIQKFKFFPIESLRVHEHKLFIDKQIVSGTHGSPEIMVHLHFTFFHNERYHEMKIFEHYANERHYNGNDFIFISYGTPGFNYTKRNLTADFYSFLDKNKIFGNFKKVQKWSGFEEIGADIFKIFIDEIISISEVENKNIQDVDELLKSEFCQAICSETHGIKFHYAKMLEKKIGYSKNSFLWLNNWSQEMVSFDDIPQKDSKFPDYGRNFRTNQLVDKHLNFKAVFNLFEAATSGIILSWLLFSSEPYNIDLISNKILLGITSNQTITQWIHTLSPQHGDAIQTFFELHYKLSSLSIMLASFFLLFILFFQSKNKALVFFVNSFVVIWLCLFGYVFQGFKEKSVHLRIYLTLLIGNIVGFIFYTIFLIKGRKKKEKKN